MSAKKKWARVVGGEVVEVIELPADVAVADAVHPSLATSFVDGGSTAGLEQGWRYVGGTLLPPATPPLDQVKAVRISGLRVACAAELVGGFASSALDSPMVYPSTETDQRNLLSAMITVAGEDTALLWCADNPNAASAWLFRPHTAAQVLQVGRDWQAFQQAARARLVTLTADVHLASDADAVAAVAW